MSGLDKRFEVVRTLGAGTFGTVFHVIDRLTGIDCALKELRHAKMEGRRDADGFGGMSKASLRDVSLLKELSHPNIVCLFDIVHTSHALYCVMELMESDLASLLYGLESRLSAGAVKLFMRQLCKGLAYCHAHMVMHRDIKPQNLLVNSATRTLKIADFGLARVLSPSADYSPDRGTIWYRAPELILGSASYSLSIDMWSVGCVFAEMATRRPLMRGLSDNYPTESSEIEVLFTIFKTLGTPDDTVWPGVTGLPDFQAEFPKWPPPQRTKSSSRRRLS